MRKASPQHDNIIRTTQGRENRPTSSSFQQSLHTEGFLLSAKDWNWCYDFNHPPTPVSTLHLSLCLMPSPVPRALLDNINKLHKDLKGSRRKPETPSSPAKEPNLLSQCFLNIKGNKTHLGILLPFRFWFRRSGLGRESLHFWQAPRRCSCHWPRTTNGGTKYQRS